MKLSSIFNNAEQPEHKKELSEGKFLEILKSKATNSHHIAKHTPLFRQDSGPDMMLVTPESKDIRSGFWIDKMIKDIPAWSKMPSRSKFIKAYTNFERTFGGDDVYVMIPLDGTRLGIAPEASFYRSFKDIKKSLGFDSVDNQTFKDWIKTVNESLAQLTNVKIELYEPETFSQFKKALLQIDKIIQKDRHVLEKNLSVGEALSPEQTKIFKDLLSRYITSCENYLSEKLEPETNGFHSIRMESFSKGTGDHEIWTDKPVLLIKRLTYIEMNKRGSL